MTNLLKVTLMLTVMLSSAAFAGMPPAEPIVAPEPVSSILFAVGGVAMVYRYHKKK